MSTTKQQLAKRACKNHLQLMVGCQDKQQLCNTCGAIYIHARQQIAASRAALHGCSIYEAFILQRLQAHSAKYNTESMQPSAVEVSDQGSHCTLHAAQHSAAPLQAHQCNKQHNNVSKDASKQF